MKESRIAQPAAQPGDVIAHYRLVERLGRDSDTTIYRAKDLTLDRDVAVKVLSPEHAASATALERFRREAHIASLVTHPHICAVHDSGEENGHAFLVCELLEGRGLDAVPCSRRIGSRSHAGSGDSAGRRHRGRAPPRSDPRKHQAVERLRDRRRARQGARARLDERVVGNLRAARRCRQLVADGLRRPTPAAGGRGRRLPLVSVARASGRSARRSPERHLLDWRGALRDGDRKQSLPWRHSVAHRRCDRVRYAAAS